MHWNLIPYFDLLALLIYLTSFVFLIRHSRELFKGVTSVFFLVTLFIMIIVSVSNFMEHINLTSVLDPYEDFLEILFIPLLIFSVYSLSFDSELQKRKIAEKTLRENKDRLNYALEGANEGLWDWDINTNSLYFSSEFYTMLDYKPFSFIANRGNWIKLVHPEQRTKEKEYKDSFFDGDDESRTIELKLLCADGTFKWVILKGKTVERNPDGSPARISGIILDISSMKKIEKDLTLAKEKAEESEKLKSAFLANMSHEIRTPLNGIIGFADLLQDNIVTKERQKEYLSYINKNSYMLLNLINDIVEISKIESGLLKLNFESFSLNELLEDIYVFYKSTQSEKLKDLQFLFSPGLKDEESVILSDQTRLRQIINNLIDNAFKNTDEGFVKFGYQKENDSKILFFVEDSGVGIEKEAHEVIFERFRQADSGKEIKKGSGLGLTICKGLVSKLKGNIWVESEIGEGAKFNFRIPYRKGLKSTSKSSSTIENLDWSNYKILIVDDDTVSIRFLIEVLKNTGIQIIDASNGNDAIRKFSANSNFDLVLLDIQLPDIDGHQVVKKIRTFSPDIPIIAQTAYAMEHEKEKCIQSGFTDYIAKPIIPIKLLQLVNSHLKKQ